MASSDPVYIITIRSEQSNEFLKEEKSIDGHG